MKADKKLNAQLVEAGHTFVDSLDELGAKLGSRGHVNAGLTVGSDKGGYLLAAAACSKGTSMLLLQGDGDIGKLVAGLHKAVERVSIEIVMVGPGGGFPPCKDPRFCEPPALMAIAAARRQTLVAALGQTELELARLKTLPGD